MESICKMLKKRKEEAKHWNYDLVMNNTDMTSNKVCNEIEVCGNSFTKPTENPKLGLTPQH